MRRQITGKIYRTDDTPWRDVIAKFSRSSSSYTYTTQYPSDSVRCNINDNGDLVDCYLWCNEEGDTISTYSCEVGRDCFTFSLPVGDGSPIALSVLRAGSDPVETYPQSIIDYVDNKVASVGGEALKINFSQANVINSRYVDITHNFGSYPLIQIFRESFAVSPDDFIQLTVNVTRIDLISFVPLPGNWLAIVSK